MQLSSRAFDSAPVSSHPHEPSFLPERHHARQRSVHLVARAPHPLALLGRASRTTRRLHACDRRWSLATAEGLFERAARTTAWTSRSEDPGAASHPPQLVTRARRPATPREAELLLESRPAPGSARPDRVVRSAFRADPRPRPARDRQPAQKPRIPPRASRFTTRRDAQRTWPVLVRWPGRGHGDNPRRDWSTIHLRYTGEGGACGPARIDPTADGISSGKTIDVRGWNP